MAQIIKARLTDEIYYSAELFGVIHSKFSEVINIRFNTSKNKFRLITMITPDMKGMPDSITVNKEYFNKISSLPIGGRVRLKNKVFSFESIFEVLQGDVGCLKNSCILIPQIVEHPGLPPNLSKFIQEVNQSSYKSYFTEDSFGLSREREIEIESYFNQFADGWLENDRQKMEMILLKLTGMGIGLTPSCDDAFLGMIATFTGAKIYADLLVGNKDRFSSRCNNLINIDDLTSFHTLLLNRTTDVSLKYLTCSQEGRFSDPILDLIQAVFSWEENVLKPYVEAVGIVGGSSGMDMLYGMNIACRKLIKLS